jgi:hypothetical protein
LVQQTVVGVFAATVPTGDAAPAAVHDPLEYARVAPM